MPASVVIYTLVHQPRRPRLPAAPLSPKASPAELAEAVFDEPLNRRYFRKVARYCYHPAVDAFLTHLDAGLKLNLGLSFSFLRQAQAWDPDLLEKFRHLVSHPNVELIGVEPYHSFLFWLDLKRFRDRMAWMREALYELLGKRPTVTDTTEMTLSPEIHATLDSLSFRGVFAEGRWQLLEWRSPTYLYRQPGRELLMLPRHNTLSDDVGYRFSDREWKGHPLRASDYARWIHDTDGDLVVLGWDFETFGEHHNTDSGIFEFLRWLPGEFRHHGVTTLTASEALAQFTARAHDLYHVAAGEHLGGMPVPPTTWAGKGDLSFFLGNPIQQHLFHLMRHAYHLAALSEDPELIDIALWLCQSDNLHLLQWSNHVSPHSHDLEQFSSEAEVAAYFTPAEWWRLGHERLLRELCQVYENFIRALSARLARRPPGQVPGLAPRKIPDLAVVSVPPLSEPAPATIAAR
jgi:alpha-amylase